MKQVLSFALLCAFVFAILAVAQDSNNDLNKASNPSEKARVFITDSQSWEVSGGAGAANGALGSATQGGARPQTAEIIKTFGERCPEVVTNNIQDKADYIVLLDHEGGKSVLQHRNKVVVFARVSGDSVVSKSTMTLGASVQEACQAIHRDWAAHGSALHAAAMAAQAKPDPPAAASSSSSSSTVPATAKLSVASTPDGADIEVDGGFVGNTPSEIQIPEGDHIVSVKKNGFTEWQRKLKVSGGSTVHLTAELEKVGASSPAN